MNADPITTSSEHAKLSDNSKLNLQLLRRSHEAYGYPPIFPTLPEFPLNLSTLSDNVQLKLSAVPSSSQMEFSKILYTSVSIMPTFGAFSYAKTSSPSYTTAPLLSHNSLENVSTSSSMETNLLNFDNQNYSKEVIIQEMLRQATIAPAVDWPPIHENLSVRQEKTKEQDLKNSSNKSNMFSIDYINTLPVIQSSDIGDSHQHAPLLSIKCTINDNVKNESANRLAIKTKLQACRQCGFQTQSKEALWKHLHQHINPEKAIRCPRCPFVTEYKHHLEYHIRNHFNSKPFQCEKCSYRCVNKSMLNSHMKSHTNIYQYRCIDCSYATKYSHSLKQHLRKYNHFPADIVSSLNDIVPTESTADNMLGDFSISPSSIKLNETSPELNNQLSMCLSRPMYFPDFSQLPYAFSAQNVNADEPLDFTKAKSSIQFHDDGDDDDVLMSLNRNSSCLSTKATAENQEEPIDLTLGSTKRFNFEAEAFPRLENIVRRLQRGDSQKCEIKSSIEARHFHWSCEFCGLMFRDILLHQLHMNFHSVNESDSAFTCAQCQKPCYDSIEFNLHLLNESHI